MGQPRATQGNPGQPTATQGNPGQPRATHLKFHQNAFFSLKINRKQPLNSKEHTSVYINHVNSAATLISGKKTQGNPHQNYSK